MVQGGWNLVRNGSPQSGMLAIFQSSVLAATRFISAVIKKAGLLATILSILRLSEELIATRTQANIERPNGRPRVLGWPQPLETGASLLREMFTRLADLSLMCMGACSIAIGSMPLCSDNHCNSLNCVSSSVRGNKTAWNDRLLKVHRLESTLSKALNNTRHMCFPDYKRKK